MAVQRITIQTLMILAELASATEPIWGLELIRRCDLKSGTVYPILDRLQEGGWVKSFWEDENDRPGPRRRLYSLTPEGREGHAGLLEAKAASSVNRGKNQKVATGLSNV